MINKEPVFSSEEVDALNQHQMSGQFHPFTCPNDGDESHIMYEFNKEHAGENYDDYIKEQKKVVNYPEMMFNQTSLVATENGFICPVCDYKQNWAHNFMKQK